MGPPPRREGDRQNQWVKNMWVCSAVLVVAVWCDRPPSQRPRRTVENRIDTVLIEDQTIYSSGVDAQRTHGDIIQPTNQPTTDFQLGGVGPWIAYRNYGNDSDGVSFYTNLRSRFSLVEVELDALQPCTLVLALARPGTLTCDRWACMLVSCLGILE